MLVTNSLAIVTLAGTNMLITLEMDMSLLRCSEPDWETLLISTDHCWCMFIHLGRLGGKASRIHLLAQACTVISRHSKLQGEIQRSHGLNWISTSSRFYLKMYRATWALPFQWFQQFLVICAESWKTCPAILQVWKPWKAMEHFWLMHLQLGLGPCLSQGSRLRISPWSWLQNQLKCWDCDSEKPLEKDTSSPTKAYQPRVISAKGPRKSKNPAKIVQGVLSMSPQPKIEIQIKDVSCLSSTMFPNDNHTIGITRFCRSYTGQGQHSFTKSLNSSWPEVSTLDKFVGPDV